MKIGNPLWRYRLVQVLTVLVTLTILAVGLLLPRPAKPGWPFLNSPPPTPTLSLALPAPSTPGRHLYGLVGQGSLGEPLDRALLATQYAAGVRLRLLELGWNVLQPNSATDWDAEAASRFQARIDAFAATGSESRIVLDLGIQYSPAWVSAVDPLMDQYGNVWEAADGGGGVNVYWSARVRGYTAAYIRRVFAMLDFHGRLWAVRVGVYGGELLYPRAVDPPAGTDAQPAGGESFWAYDAAAQADSPVPGWRPGDASGDIARARTFYYWYVDNLVATFEFLLAAIRDAAPGPTRPYVAPVTPGVGRWDGPADQLIARGLVDLSQRGYGSGDYWQRIYARLPARDAGVLNWCSSVGDRNAGADDTSPDWWEWSSARQQAYLARLNGREIFAENPGENPYDASGDVESGTTMRWVFATIADPTYPYAGLLWVRQADMVASPAGGSFASLEQYAALVRANP